MHKWVIMADVLKIFERFVFNNGLIKPNLIHTDMRRICTNVAQVCISQGSLLTQKEMKIVIIVNIFKVNNRLVPSLRFDLVAL